MGEQEYLRMASEKMLGHGSERHVYPHEDSNKVVKIIHTDKYEVFEPGNENAIKGEFYLTKILHFLRPEIIPDIHLTSHKYQATVNERKNTGEDHNIIRDASVRNYQAEQQGKTVNYSADERSASANLRALVNESNIYQEFTDLGLTSDAIDYSAHNFSETQKDSIEYIDSVLPWNNYRKGAPTRAFKQFFDAEKIKTAILAKPASPEQTRALQWLEHLIQLADTEKIKRAELIAKNGAESK